MDFGSTDQNIFKNHFMKYYKEINFCGLFAKHQVI